MTRWQSDSRSTSMYRWLRTMMDDRNVVYGNKILFSSLLHECRGEIWDPLPASGGQAFRGSKTPFSPLSSRFRICPDVEVGMTRCGGPARSHMAVLRKLETLLVTPRTFPAVMHRDHTAVSNARVSSERTLCDVPGAEPGAMDAFSSRGKGADTPPKGGLLRGLVDTWIPVGNDTLGKGGFSEARLVRGELAGREAVAKTTVLPASDPTDRVLFHSLREALALVHMPPHKSLPKILDFLHADGTVHLVMTRAPGQSQELYSYVNSQPQGRLPEREARLIVANLLEVLRHCHAHGVLHRDVKLDNVMWDPTSQQLTLIDFGLATFFNDRTMFTEAVGCINYASCAMLRFVNQRRPYSGAKGHPDLWALGVLTHGLLTGYFPFRSEEMATLQREIESLGTLHIEGASSEALDFLSIVLDPRNEGRFTAASLLSHPWVAGLVPTGRLFPRKPPPRVPAPYGDCKRACVAAATELARLLPLHLRTKMRDEPTPAVGCLPDPLDNAPDTRIA